MVNIMENMDTDVKGRGKDLTTEWLLMYVFLKFLSLTPLNLISVTRIKEMICEFKKLMVQLKRLSLS